MNEELQIPSENDWLDTIKEGNINKLESYKNILSPDFTHPNLYLLYYYSIITLQKTCFQWFLNNYPPTKLSFSYNILYLLSDIKKLLVDEKYFRLELIPEVLKSLVFSTDEIKLVIIKILCDKEIHDLGTFYDLKRSIMSYTTFPLNIQEINDNISKIIIAKIASLCCDPDNSAYISAILYNITFSPDQIGEIIFKIKGKYPEKKGSILGIINQLVSRYLYYKNTFFLSNSIIILENHIHDPMTYKYLLPMVESPIINIYSSVKQIINKTYNLDDMIKCFDIINFSRDIIIRYTADFFTDIMDSDNKFSYIISGCNSNQINRIHDNFKLYAIEPSNTRKYFIFTIITHKKLVAKRVRIWYFNFRIKNILNKYRVLHQLSISPPCAFGKKFPGGTIYHNLLRKFERNE